MNLGRETILQRLREAKPRLMREFPLSRLAIFGSCVRGEATDASDIDVLVEVEPSIGLGFVKSRTRSRRLWATRRTSSRVGRSSRSSGNKSSRKSSMPKRDPIVLLDDIRAALGKIARYIAGLTEEGFVNDEKTIDAVVRNLEIIGEAVRRLPAELKEKHSNVEPPPARARSTPTPQKALVAQAAPLPPMTFTSWGRSPVWRRAIASPSRRARSRARPMSRAHRQRAGASPCSSSMRAARRSQPTGSRLFPSRRRGRCCWAASACWPARSASAARPESPLRVLSR